LTVHGISRIMSTSSGVMVLLFTPGDLV
jgi:hypothetical protein